MIIKLEGDTLHIGHCMVVSRYTELDTCQQEVPMSPMDWLPFVGVVVLVALLVGAVVLADRSIR